MCPAGSVSPPVPPLGWPQRWATSVAPTSSLTRTMSGRPCRCPGAGRSSSSSSRPSASRRSSSPATARTRTIPAAAAADSRQATCTTPPVKRGLPRLRPDAARLPRRVRAGGDRQPRVHPEHLARSRQRRWRDVRRRRAALPHRARVRVDPRHALTWAPGMTPPMPTPERPPPGTSPARSGRPSTR